MFTDPQAAAVGAVEAPFSGTAACQRWPKTATYTRAYAESNGFMTLLSDGERLTGAYALGPEAGEWLQQATLAIRARVPLDVLRDTIQPFPTFSEIYIAALKPSASRSPPRSKFPPDVRVEEGCGLRLRRSSWCCWWVQLLAATGMTGISTGIGQASASDRPLPGEPVSRN